MCYSSGGRPVLHCDLWRFWRLTKRKLIPSLYNLGSYLLLPAHFSIIGVARRPLSNDVFRNQLGKDLAELGTQPVDPKLWSKFRERISYCAGEFDNPATYKKLADANGAKLRAVWDDFDGDVF